jgi:hypothetical protein
MRWRHGIAGIAATFALLACGGGPAVEESQLSMHPESGKCVLVVMRPERHVGVARAPRVSLYRITPDSEEFLGVLGTGQRLSYVSPPGDQLFMVVGGENADFMQAHLDAGKTYYSFVKPRMGVLRPRYSLFPVRRADSDFTFDDKDFTRCFAKCEWRDEAESRQWYEDNKSSVEQKEKAYRRRWDARGDEYKERKIMNAEDGV